MKSALSESEGERAGERGSFVELSSGGSAERGIQIWCGRDRNWEARKAALGRLSVFPFRGDWQVLSNLGNELKLSGLAEVLWCNYFPTV